MDMSFFIEAIEGSQQAKIFSFQHTEDNKISKIQLHSQKLSLHKFNDALNERVTYIDIFSLYNLDNGLFWRTVYHSDAKEIFMLDTHLISDGYRLNQDGIFRPYKLKRGWRKKFLYISDEKITSFQIDSQGFFLIDATECYDSFEEGFNHFIIKINNNLQNGQYWFGDDQDCKYIDFTNVLSEEIIPLSQMAHFFCPLAERNPQITPDIVKIRRRQNKWYVMLQRASEKMALVVLNDDYQAIKALGEGAKKTL